MRSYGQYCALARAMDIVGERWTLLIVRELFAGDCRYSDLRDALPGIATNLLATRLRDLQGHGIVETYEAARPVRGVVYRLTPRGRQLGPVLKALVAFGGTLVDAQGADEFRTHWLVLGVPMYFDGVDVADLAPFTVAVDTGDQPAVLDVNDDGVSMRVGRIENPDVAVAGPPDAVFAALTGRRSPKASADVTFEGTQKALHRLRRLASRSAVAVA